MKGQEKSLKVCQAVRDNFDKMMDFRSSIERQEKKLPDGSKEIVSTLKDKYLFKVIPGRAHKHFPAFPRYKTYFLDWPKLIKWLSENKMEEHWDCLDREDAKMHSKI